MTRRPSRCQCESRALRATQDGLPSPDEEFCFVAEAATKARLPLCSRPGPNEKPAQAVNDGRLPQGPLLQVLREHLELKTDYDLVEVILNRWQRGRSNIAALSRVVVKAAGLGDDCARQILTNAAHELAELVDVARWRLGFGHAEAVPVSYSGGIFTVAAVLAAFREEIAGLDTDYELRQPMYQPVVGAALYAAKLAGTPLTDAALAHLARPSAPHKDVHASGASCIPTSR